MNWELLCLKCGEVLDENLHCTKCQTIYSEDKNGVLSLLNTMNSEKQNVEKLYNKLAENKKNIYGRFASYLNYGIHEKSKRYVGEQQASISLIKEICNMSDLANKRVLDVGCGRGGMLLYINNNYENCELVGIDIAYENVLFCKSYRKNIFFLRADAENIPFKKNSFDVVINIESALHYPHIELFFLEVKRILMEGGRFIYADIVSADILESRKHYLMKIGLKVVKEYDYTEKVLNSLLEKIKRQHITINGLFDHEEIFEQLRKREKHYVVWIMNKINT